MPVTQNIKLQLTNRKTGKPPINTIPPYKCLIRGVGVDKRPADDGVFYKHMHDKLPKLKYNQH
jgi:hypothetical protein